MEATEYLRKQYQACLRLLLAVKHDQETLRRRESQLIQSKAELVRLLKDLGEDIDDQVVLPAERSWTEISRREAIIRVLEEAKRPISPSEILAILVSNGRENDKTNPNGVSTTLNQLKQRGTASRVGRGRWWLSRRPLENEGIVIELGQAFETDIAGEVTPRSG